MKCKFLLVPVFLILLSSRGKQEPVDLVLEMGPWPNFMWGSDPDDALPSGL